MPCQWIEVCSFVARQPIGRGRLSSRYADICADGRQPSGVGRSTAAAVAGKAGQRGRPLRGDQMRGYPAARPDFAGAASALERPPPALPEQSRTGKEPGPSHRTDDE